MNEFSKKADVRLPGVMPPEYSLTYDVVIKVRQQDGKIVGITGPSNMPPAVTIDILATAIKAMALPMIQNAVQPEERRIIVPKLAGVKPLG